MEAIAPINLVSELKSKKIQLHWLLQITKAINYNLPADQLFEIYCSVLKDHLKVGKLLLFIHEKSWQQILSYGGDNKSFDVNPEKDFQHLDEVRIESSTKPQWISEFETIIPVIHNKKPLAYAFIGDYSMMPGNPKEVLPYIHTITNIIVVAIENKRLTKESIRQAALEREMELAAEMQSMLFPSHLNGNDAFDVAATYLPHSEVGGDYYDYFKINDDESVVCMADVSGKGLAAALLMSNFQANLHAMSRHIESLPELVKALNATVFKNAKGEKYITVFLARINHKTKDIHYINAGHNPPIHFHEGNFDLLEKGTTGLGMFDELPFLNEGTIPLPFGAILFCYTDGITELEDAAGNSFGIEKFKEFVLNNCKGCNMKEFHALMINELNGFRKEIGFNDDVTLLTVKSL